MPQHWTVAAYVAPRAEWIDTRRLDWLDLVHGTSAEARVDNARPARAEPARGRFLIEGCPAVRNVTRQRIV